VSGRTSYRRLLSLPAWALVQITPGIVSEKLVATVRAEDAETARGIFKRHGLSGDRVRRLA
jgi:hypothetical protein